MTLLAWTDELATGHAEMDQTHREFIELLDRVEAVRGADAATVLPVYDELIAHTTEHFAREDAWMQANGFAVENCHSLQHTQVLGVLQEVRKRIVEQGQVQLLGELLPGLIQWFDGHARAADAGLAAVIAEAEQARAQAAAEGRTCEPVAAMAGCGSLSCSDA